MDPKRMVVLFIFKCFFCSQTIICYVLDVAHVCSLMARYNFKVQFKKFFKNENTNSWAKF